MDSINLLKSSDIDYEFRTTLVHEFHTSSVINDIGQLLNGAKAYYLQSFVDSEFVPNHNLSAPNKEELLVFRKQLLKYINKVEIRGVDI